MGDEHATDDLVLLDLHFSGLLRGELADEVQARLEHDHLFQEAAEQYLTGWMRLLDALEPEGLVPEGAEERLMARLQTIPQE